MKKKRVQGVGNNLQSFYTSRPFSLCVSGSILVARSHKNFNPDGIQD